MLLVLSRWLEFAFFLNNEFAELLPKIFCWYRRSIVCYDHYFFTMINYSLPFRVFGKTLLQ